jgi:hypothetical protein
MKLCGIEGCGNKHYGKGLCSKHYQRWRYHGSTAEGPHALVNEKPCAVPDCDRIARTRGLCTKHYRRGQVRGTFDPVELAGPRRQRWREVYKRLDRDGYWLVWVNDAWEREHRVVMAETIGRPLHPDETVHHRNGDRADNRPENLELWIGNHGRGGRVSDVLAWAREIVERYDGKLFID